MAISLASLNRLSTPKPPRIVIYGPHGIGKNTFLASAPKPVLIDIEGGHPDGSPIDAFPQAKTFGEVMEAMGALYTEAHDFETVGIDSLDWLEPLVWAEAIRRNNEENPSKRWTTIEDAGYGKGYLAALDVWRDFLDAINALRNDKGMAVIMTAHAEVMREEQTAMLRQHKGTNLTSIIARLAENAAKIALIRAVVANPERPVMTRQDLEWGMSVARRSVDTLMNAVKERVADNEQEAKLKRLQKIIADAGSAGIEHEALFRLARFMGSRRHLNEAIEFLIEGAIVRCQKFERIDGAAGKRQRRVYFDTE
jgi:hypothetical protein